MDPRIRAAVLWASDRRVAWALLGGAVVLLVASVGLQQGRWEPAYTDYGQEGDRYTFPLNGKLERQGDVHVYWARCGHNEACGPIAFHGRPPLGLDHVVLLVPSRDPKDSTLALEQPQQADCSWRGECPDTNTTTVLVTHAWGPYGQAPVRAQQALTGLSLMLVLGALANLLRGPSGGARAVLATGAGVVLAAGMPLDGTGLFIVTIFLAIPGLVVAGGLALAGRKWPLLGRISVTLLWALLGWLVQTFLFLSWFPGPPTA